MVYGYTERKYKKYNKPGGAADSSAAGALARPDAPPEEAPGYSGGVIGGLLSVRSRDDEKRRRGRALAIMLLCTCAVLVAVTAVNLASGELQYIPTNVALLLIVIGIYVLNKCGFVLSATLSTVVLSSSVPLLLIAESRSGAYLSMVIPVLIASSLIAPWMAFVMVAAMIVLAFATGTATLALVLLLLVAAFSYLFAGSIETAYRYTRYHSRHDTLTSLPNRATFEEHIGQAMQRSARGEGQCAVLFLDLDGFKTVNDSLGHEHGDELLKVIGTRLLAQCRSGDTVGRLGGDEFALLLDPAPDEEESVRVADRIVAEVSRPVSLLDQRLEVGSSVGIAFCKHAPRMEPRALLRNADLAMYEAKKAGKRRSLVYDASMHAQTVNRLELENELKAALRDGEFTLRYQPQVSLETERIVGFEALVRWEHPERGMVYPEDFIPLAEETGLVVPLGDWVFEEACAQARAWSGDHRIARPPHHSPHVGVNVSAAQFRQPDIVKSLGKRLEHAGVSPGLVQLELTESTVTEDFDNGRRILQDLRNLGVKIALDDFGTGYSSLATIRRYPFDILKLDRQFVVDVGAGDIVSDAQDASIVRLVCDLAHTLGMEATAEGVETGAQRDLLKEIGCDVAQGYYYLEPVAPERATELLLEQRGGYHGAPSAL